ncbi:nuclear shuttle protein [Squash leaf curl Philippines virus]|uniref:Nuclear shuttle protein n=1 Tax=Squash leaf curl Philippines virus TaxID=269277 RepID=Q80IW9_9GEMI|nr:nuclear shuttle protein [Squash leaf curl Philippines virus]BAC55519.1 nuclear shuttle protein [Squash leaf curl Philippines virus]
MAFTTSYTPARRYSYSTNRQPNASRRWKFCRSRKYHGLMRYRNLYSASKTSTDLFGDPISRQYTRKEICETQQGSEYVLQNNRYMTTYVTYPAKTRTGTNNRVRSYIKLTGLTMSGTFGIRCSELMTDVINPLDFMALYRLLSSGINHQRFIQLYNHSCLLLICLVLLVPVVGLLRWQNDRHEKVCGAQSNVHTDKYASLQRMKKFSIRNCIPRTYSTWATFKDEEEDSSTGLYSNTLRNAILIYYVWLSDVPSQLDMYSNVMLNYIG